jgi:very-short-patch-repair endonuclease
MWVRRNPKENRIVQNITLRARLLRKNQTLAEEVLWERIRDRKIGWKLVRQKPILLEYYGKKRAFIADFCCKETGYVIEIDGIVHASQADYDSLRTLLLRQKGFDVIRFTNDEVIDNVGLVVEKIKRIFAGNPSPHPPSGHPLRIAERENP